MGNRMTRIECDYIPEKDFIVKDSNMNSKFYTNNYLREWVVENGINISLHKWLPLGTNYDFSYVITNNGIIGEVYNVRTYFYRSNLPIDIHLINITKFSHNCYILLTQKQQQLLGLIQKEEKEEYQKIIPDIFVTDYEPQPEIDNLPDKPIDIIDNIINDIIDKSIEVNVNSDVDSDEYDMI